MSKERVSASVDPEVAQYLSREDVNASGLINKLVRQHMGGGVTDDYLRELREKQLKSEISSLESRAETKREELERIEDVKEQSIQEQQEDIDSRLRELETVRMVIDESHPSVNGLARDHFDGDTEAALEAMKERNAELEIVPGRYL